MNELVVLLCISISSLGMSDYRNKKACKYIPEIISSASKHNIEPEILISLIFVESSFHRKAVSHAGACGLTQVMPKYTGKITRKYTCEQLKNPKTSIRAGAKILSWWIKYHDNDLKKALCSYNAGFRCGKNKKRKISKHGMKYAEKVLRKSKLILDKKNSTLK